MEELYWIGVLDRVNDACSFLLTITLIALATSVIGCCLYFESHERGAMAKFKKVCVWSAVFAIVFLALCIFLPSKKELYTIYGIGSVIDYVQDNEQAKALPDNAVKAINKYLETINK